MSVLFESISASVLATKTDEQIVDGLMALKRMRALQPGTNGYAVREAYQSELARRLNDDNHRVASAQITRMHAALAA